MMGKAKDYTGQKFGRLTFVRMTEQRRSGGIVWELLCDCGTTAYSVGKEVASGKTVTCGCSRRTYLPEISTARTVWNTNYKDGDIDFDTFYYLSQQQCYYCGREPHRTTNVANKRKNRNPSSLQIDNGNFTYNGLDRVDSTQRHDKDNVVTCCWTCNSMKLEMTQQEFLDHIERMYRHTRRLIDGRMLKTIEHTLTTDMLDSTSTLNLPDEVVDYSWA